MTSGLVKRFSLFLLAVLCLLCTLALYLPGIDTIWLYHEETRRALVAREMMENSTWFTPTINQQAYWAKPPLFNWFIILASVFTDGQINEISARLPSLLATLMLAIFLLIFSRRYFNFRLQAWLLIMVLFTPELIRKATSAELDTVFMVLVNFSLFSWFYFWQKQQFKSAWLVSMTFIGMAYLCKREAALLCYFLSIFGYLIYVRQWSSVSKRQFFTALLIPILCAAIWWLPMLLQFGVQASIELNQAEVAARQNQGTYIDYLIGVFTYPVAVWIALLPASLLIPFIFSSHYRRYLATTYGHCYYFCLIATASNLLPIMLIGDSNVRYYLPMFIPALLLATMILDAWFAVDRTQEKIENGWTSLYQKGLSTPLPLVFYGVIIIGCILLMTTATVSWQSNLGLIAVCALATLFMILQLRQAHHNIPPAKGFALFAVLLVLLVRMADISYSLPYRYQSLKNYRNIELMLEQIKHIRDNMEQSISAIGSNTRISIYGDHSLSHALYFYDQSHLITSINCNTFESRTTALWLSIQSNNKPIAIVSGDKLMAQFPYTKKYRLLVIATENPSQYCPLN